MPRPPYRQMETKMYEDNQQEKEFLEVLHQSQRTLVKICFLYTRHNRDYFNDLYQEIAAKLWEAWSQFRGEAASNTWVTRIALSVALQEKRRRKYQPEFVKIDPDLADTLIEEASDPCYDRLYQLIDSLPDDEDRKFLYLYLDHYTYNDIDLIYGISQEAVKQKMYRIRKQLKNIKQQQDEE